MVKSKSCIATPPGATIKEQLTEREMSQKEFAARMGMSEKHISRLINGEVQLTPDMAVKLEMVLGVPARFWSNLEAVYREKLVKVKNENEMDRDIQLVKKLPYSEMAKNGWVPETKKIKEKVIYSRKFFEVVNLDLIENPSLNGIACRRINESEKANLALLAWAQEAKLEARNIATLPVDIKSLKKETVKIREMTEKRPEEFCPELRKILSECGIAIVFLPHLDGSFLHGATFMDGSKIVMGLTVRGRDADKFWFSLFHELGHIICGHIGQENGTTEEDEKQADYYAENTLIPDEKLHMLIERNDFSQNAILRFASYAGIDAGIVVGRLQREGLIEYSRYNDLKSKYAL